MQVSDQKRISYEAIINVEDQSRLMSVGEIVSNGYFEIGDIANRIIEEHRAEGTLGPPEGLCTRKDIYAACAYYAGLQPRTVRHYAEVARKAEPELREQFPTLTAAHFAVATKTRYADQEQRAEEILEWAADNNASAAMTEAHFNEVIGKEAFKLSDLSGIRDSLIGEIRHRGVSDRVLEQAVWAIDDAVYVVAATRHPQLSYHCPQCGEATIVYPRNPEKKNRSQILCFSCNRVASVSPSVAELAIRVFTTQGDEK